MTCIQSCNKVFLTGLILCKYFEFLNSTWNIADNSFIVL